MTSRSSIQNLRFGNIYARPDAQKYLEKSFNPKTTLENELVIDIRKKGTVKQ